MHIHAKRVPRGAIEGASAMKQKLTTLFLALALCLSLLPTQAMAAQAEVTVTIFTTNAFQSMKPSTVSTTS